MNESEPCAEALSVRKTVLVVDDVPENLSIAYALLRGTYIVKLATSGAQALEIASRSRPDLILLDVVMPGMDGCEVCRRLKADSALTDIPVIFVTARSDEADEQRGFDLGAVDYIAKPFSPSIVIARVRAQLALKEARDALQQRIQEEKRRFEIALAQQVELNVLKSTFVSMATHEFRTPLTAIQSSQELLHLYGDRLTPEDRDATLLSIDVAVKRMVAMMDEVLRFGRAEATVLSFRPAPLNPAALCRQLRDDALAGFRPPDGQPSPDIRLELALNEAPVTLDEKLLRHVLGNLLSNALKYSPNTAEVRLSARRESNALVFEVADQGIGIPAEDLPHLFGQFHRASNVGTIPGSGLGLAIVKRAVETHGGRISVESTPGQGTAFRVRIPLNLPVAG